MTSREKEDHAGLIKKLISSVLVSSPVQSLTLSELDTDYQRQIGEAIPFSALGYSSLEEYLVAIPDVVKIQLINGIKIVKPVVSSKVNHIYKLISKQKKPAIKKKPIVDKLKYKTPANVNLIPVIIRSRLKSLIKSFKDGLLCAELPGVYKARFKKELNYHMFKYASLLEMCQALTTIFVCRRVRTGEVMLFAIDEDSVGVPQPLNTRTDNGLVTSTPNRRVMVREPSCEFQETTLNDEVIYPFNVLKFEESIPCQFIPSHINIYDCVKVYVTEIYDPSKFWITLHECSSGFELLHYNMQLWYSRCFNFKIDERFVRFGIFCSVPYKGEFYRAMVVKLMLDNHLVKVFFIDYGTVSVIDSRKLLFLHKNFSYLPQQAIRARLGGIYPRIAQSPWPKAAFKQLSQFVTEEILVAQIMKINYESEIVEIILKDGLYRECINDILVDKGHAIYTFEEQTQERFTNMVPSVEFIHLYPTFNEIELGVVPNHIETKHLLEMGISYDYLYPHYFKKEVDNDYSLNNATGVSINVSDEPNLIRLGKSRTNMPHRYTN